MALIGLLAVSQVVVVVARTHEHRSILVALEGRSLIRTVELVLKDGRPEHVKDAPGTYGLRVEIAGADISGDAAMLGHARAQSEGCLGADRLVLLVDPTRPTAWSNRTALLEGVSTLIVA
jgi:hypothetical protein